MITNSEENLDYQGDERENEYIGGADAATDGDNADAAVDGASADAAVDGDNADATMDGDNADAVEGEVDAASCGGRLGVSDGVAATDCRETSVDRGAAFASGNTSGGGSRTPIIAGYVLHTVIVALITIAMVITTQWFTGYLTPPNAVTFGIGNQYAANAEKLQQVWNLISNEFYEKPDENKMIEYATAGIVAAVGDPYTVYYPKAEMVKLKERTSGNYQGIGVYLSLGEDGRFLIQGFLEGSSAEEAGVMIDDEIVSVDGVDVRGYDDLNKIAEMIKGKSGASIVIGFFRAQENRYIDIEITRKAIKVENIKSHMIDSSSNSNSSSSNNSNNGDGNGNNGDGNGNNGDGNGKKIGYIQILMFDSSASEYFNMHLDSIIEGGADGLIIDVRDNPGGSFDGVVSICDRLLGEGVIVYTQDRRERREYRYSRPEKLEMPLRVLVNGGSASASEILAGAIKDHGAGLIIGTTTYGKGLVQDVVTLGDGSGLVYTKSRYFTPSGVCIQGEGIEPDEVVELPEEVDGVNVADIPFEKDFQLQKAISSFDF